MGLGAYFAENVDKSLQYAPSEDGVHYVLLCRVLAGNMYHTTENKQQNADVCARRDNCHAVLANPGGQGPREFIMLSEDQVYPEYILELRSKESPDHSSTSVQVD